MEFLIMVDIFPIFLLEEGTYCQGTFQKLSLNPFDFFANWVIIFLEQIAPSYQKQK